MNQDKIGKFIYELRKGKNLSQYQLADMIPISRQAVSKWERGESVPDSQTLLQLSDIFDVTINELLTGERKDNNSIKDLEKTTLKILDESNNKSKRMKRNFHISVITILILLISFLSYYFINSYNSIKVYTISGEGKTSYIKDGILLVTKKKVYIKLGKVTSLEDKNINSIKLYYLNNNKKHFIVKNKDVDELFIADYNGYSEKIFITNLDKIMKNTYIEINYEDNNNDKIKLNFKKNYKNTNLFFKREKQFTSKRINYKDVSIILTQDEKKEEKEESKTEDKPAPNLQKEESVVSITEHKEDLKVKVEEEFNINNIIENIKERSLYFEGNYIYEDENDCITVIYFEETNQITAYINDEFGWDYYIKEDRYNCGKNNDKCKDTVIKMLEKYFK